MSRIVQRRLRRDAGAQASGPPTLTDDQRRAHESASEQLSIACEIVAEGTSDSEDPHAEQDVAEHAEPPFLDGVLLSTDVDARTDHQDAPPADRARWWAWTAALLGANGAWGAFETFVGRLGEALVSVLSGHPEEPRKVNDLAMAAHATVNLAVGWVAGARAGLHVWRGRGNAEAYRTGFRGGRSALSPALAMAGTPTVPASQLLRLLFSVIAAVLTFVLAAHTGMIALWYLRTSSDDKVSAYQAVILSNGNTFYCYSREVVNLVAFVFELVSHDALLSRPGFAGSIVEYGGNWAVQRRARKRYRIDPARGSDLRWPLISALAEAVDVAFISAAARLAEPDRPVRIWRGRLAERASAEADPQSTLTNIDAIDRVTQRAVGRQLVGELSNVLPAELRLPLLGLLAAGTHLRELA